MKNEISLREAADYLNHLAEKKIGVDRSSEEDKELLALLVGASMIKSVADGELILAPVKCGECIKRGTSMCHAGHEQADMDFCSHGVRKGGGFIVQH